MNACIEYPVRACRVSKYNCYTVLPQQHPECNVLPPEASFSLGDALESYQPLLESVFFHLTFADLCTVKEVNSVWRELAEREVLKRTSPARVMSYKQATNILQVDPNFYYSDIGLSFIACSGKPERKVCVHDSDGTQLQPFSEYIEGMVPTKENFCCIHCRALTNTTIRDSSHRSITFHGVYIPRIPKVRIFVFSDIKAKVSSVVRVTDRIRCVLPFHHNNSETVVKWALGGIFARHRLGEIAMAGGVVSSVQHSAKPPNRRSVFVVFTEDENDRADFDAFSIILTEDVEKDPKAFSARIEFFKQHAVLRKHGVIFKFCCFARKARKLEDEIVEKSFPGYTILCMDVGGEYGWNSMFPDNNMTPPEPKKVKVQEIPEVLHSCTSTMALVTWGKIKTN